MPTVVALPQLQNVDTSAGQPLYNQHIADHSGNLLDFLMGVGQGIKSAQDKNKDADQALGEIDAVNGVVRDVGLFHKQNYNAGQQYGALMQDHVKKDAQFKQALDDLIKNNPDATPEDVQALATSVSRDEVATIYNNSSNIKDKKLLGDMYQQVPKFYASRLAAGQKALTAAAGERLSNLRNISQADMMSFMNQDTYDAPALVNKYVTTYTALKNAYVSIGKNPQEAANAADSDMLSTMSALKELAKVNPTSDNAVAWSNNIKTLLGEVIKEPNISPEFKGKLASVVDDIQSSVQKENGSMMDIQMSQYVLNNLSNPRTMATSEDQVNQQIGMIINSAKSGKISWADASTNINRLTSAYSEFTGKKISLKPLPAQLGAMPYQQAHHDYGTSAQEWAGYKLELFNDQYPQDPAAAGFKAIGYAMAGENYMPELVQQAGLQIYRQFGGILKMTPTQFGQLGETGAYKAKQYEAFKNVVQQAIQQGSPAADDIIAMLPDDVREAVRENIANGGTIGDLQSKLANPVEYSQKAQNFEKQISQPDFKKMGLGKYWKGGTSQASSGQYWGHKPSDTDEMQQALARSYANVYKNDKSYYIDGATTDLPSNIIPNMLSKGSLIQSPKGYAAVGLNIQKVQTINRALGNGADTSYVVGHTLDLYREQYAKMYKTDPKNIIVSSTGFGANGNILFEVYDKDGKTLLNNTTLNMHNLIQQAKKNYTQYKADIQSKEASHTPTGFNEADNYKTPVLYNKSGTFAQDVPVKEGFGSGIQYRVNLPNTMTLGYNGNTGLTLAAVRHLNMWEGWHNGIKQVKGDNTYTVAQQVLVQDRSGKRNKYYAMALKAKTPQDFMNIQGEWMKDNMGALQPAARKIGIPVATTAMYPATLVQYQMLLTDALWLGGNGGMNKVVEALTSNTDAVRAINQLKSSSYWKSMQPDRQKWAAHTIANYMYAKQGGFIK